jgi:hypothetical protein
MHVYQVEKVQLTNYTYVASTKKIDKHPWYVTVHRILMHSTYGLLFRYFLLQRKPGVKSENGIDARKTFVSGPFHVYHVATHDDFFCSYHFSASSQQIFDEWQVAVHSIVFSLPSANVLQECLCVRNGLASVADFV